MRSVALYSLAAAAVLAGSFCAATAAPLAAYGRLPAIDDVVISGNGERLAFLAQKGEMRSVSAYDLTAGKTLASAGVGETKVRSLLWAGDRSVIVGTTSAATLYDYDTDLTEWLIPQTLDVQTGKVAPLLKPMLGLVGGAMAMPDIRETSAGATAFMTVPFQGNASGLALFTIDMPAGKVRTVTEGHRKVRAWTVSATGAPLARSVFDRETGDFRIERADGKGWRTVYQANSRFNRYHLMGLGRDGDSLLVNDSGPDGRMVLIEVDAQGGARQIKADADPDRLIFDRRTQALIALGYGGDNPRYAFFNRRLAERWSAVLPMFPPGRLLLQDFDAAMDRLVVRVETAGDAGSYHLVDFRGETPRITAIGAAYPDLRAEDLSEVRKVAYKAADGLDLDGYLTLPRGKDPKALPLIVLAHGGPESQDEPGFDWWSQALASRGYAVLQVNFRGSSNKDAAFRDAGFGEWGGKMQTDLSDGVRHLAKEGLIDPRRVCIMGASYGGYAALAGPTLDTGVYRCAVSVSGVSDLKAMLTEEVSDGDKVGVRYWRRFMGVDKNPDLAVQRSPLRLAAKADAPILLLHGQDDSIVPFEQSKRMADALKAAGKTYRFVPLQKEDHWLSREDSRQRMLSEAVAFVEQYNPPN